MFDYDAELRRHARRLTEAVDVGPDDHVLDIGCGAGQTTRDAARVAVRGSALGVDISPEMVALARERAEGIANVRFEEADAQVHAFPRKHFTIGMSRFGTMFFADPRAAFTNIRGALAPGARLVLLVWQAADRQEWVREIRGAVGPTEAGMSAFSLAEPSTVDALLTVAGFTAVTMTEMAEPVWYGPDAAAAVDAVQLLRMVGDQEPATLDRLHKLMTAHTDADGVWFDSRAWVVRATA